MKIGIIGAENSHTARIAEILNVKKRVKGFSVDYLWGETPQFAAQAASAGRIPNLVGAPLNMLGKIDALIVDHRHPEQHLPAALPFVKKGIPVFIDKPFCYRAAEGKRFLAVCRKSGAPVASFSAIRVQKSFMDFAKAVRSAGHIRCGVTYGSCDIKSPYGGVFFYGIHQVECALNAFGFDVQAVRVTANAPNACAQLLYENGLIVTINLVREGCPFAAAAVGEKGVIHQELTYDDDPYLAGVKLFTTMFRSRKEPESHEQLLRPVQVLEAMEKALQSGVEEKVARYTL